VKRRSSPCQPRSELQRSSHFDSASHAFPAISNGLVEELRRSDRARLTQGLWRFLDQSASVRVSAICSPSFGAPVFLSPIFFLEELK
jgi:hypothetical protein